MSKFTVYDMRPFGVSDIIFRNPEVVRITDGGEFNRGFRRSYGKDYIQAEHEMHRVMFPRIERILSIWRKIKKHDKILLMDVGAAYGTFLTCLPHDWEAFGIEPMADVAEYARKVLRRKVLCAEVTKFKTPWPVNVVTMWNVIEHLPDPLKALRKLYDNLSPGGIVCISTPNAAGGYFRFNRGKYEEGDDPSHEWAFSPRTLSALLKAAGFSVVKVVTTGHHPDRWGGCMWLSKLLRLGDTFEIYARRKP